MKRSIIALVLLAQSLLVFGQAQNAPYVILVSFDGFRSDYIKRFDLPNFNAFIKEGAAADGLIPSFPSKTFPNHYSIVTGLYPGHHGLVDNHFFDPAKNAHYSMRIRNTVTDPSYYGGTPLWTLAKKHGLRSASYFWVGSELEDEALHPDYYFNYDQSVPFLQRVDQVVEWLSLPEAERPHLITLYFSSPDSESHEFGPLAEETKKKLFAMDSLLGNFMEKVKATGLPVNVILVSDHGMKELEEKEDTYIFIDELIAAGKQITVVNGGTQAHIYTRSSEANDSLFHVLKKKTGPFRILRKHEFPAKWNYQHDRSGDLLLIAEPGKYIVSGNRKKFLAGLKRGTKFGVHGYDADDVNDMYGIFYANGPNVVPGARINAFRNIHVYPFIANILGLAIPPIDGDPQVLAPIYRK